MTASEQRVGGKTSWVNIGVGRCWAFPGGSVVKNPPANVGDTGDAGLIPESGRYPRRGNGNPESIK